MSISGLICGFRLKMRLVEHVELLKKYRSLEMVLSIMGLITTVLIITI